MPSCTPNLGRSQFIEQYADVYTGSDEWRAIEASGGEVFSWSDESTYIHRPPFFAGMTSELPGISEVKKARVLCLLADSVTTDHISPAGGDRGGFAGRSLAAGTRSAGEHVQQFRLPAGQRSRHDPRHLWQHPRPQPACARYEGGWTTDFTDGKVKSIFEASCNYKDAGIPLVVLAGKDYGMGSSRDWAAKGTFLLGVSAVIAESYERIHRSNLVGMGVVPLQSRRGPLPRRWDWMAPSRSISRSGTISSLGNPVHVTAVKSDGSKVDFDTTCRADTPVEIEYLKNGGILHTVPATDGDILIQVVRSWTAVAGCARSRTSRRGRPWSTSKEFNRVQTLIASNSPDRDTSDHVVWDASSEQSLSWFNCASIWMVSSWRTRFLASSGLLVHFHLIVMRVDHDCTSFL